MKEAIEKHIESLIENSHWTERQELSALKRNDYLEANKLKLLREFYIQEMHALRSILNSENAYSDQG